MMEKYFIPDTLLHQASQQPAAAQIGLKCPSENATHILFDSTISHNFQGPLYKIRPSKGPYLKKYFNYNFPTKVFTIKIYMYSVCNVHQIQRHVFIYRQLSHYTIFIFYEKQCKVKHEFQQYKYSLYTIFFSVKCELY